MLATPGPLPGGPEWTFEPKFDGIRLICDIHPTAVRLTSRTERDLTGMFPEVVRWGEQLAGAGTNVLLDGELVAAWVPVPHLQDIAARIHRAHPPEQLVRTHPVRFIVFDLLRLAGSDLTAHPLNRRRARLEGLVPSASAATVIDVFDDGAALWQATADEGMEGVVAKRRDSHYRPGTRSPHWVKTVHRATDDLVIIGWRAESARPDRIGSLVVAQPASGTLRPVGSVGSGMTASLSHALAAVLPSLARDDPPVDDADLDPAVRWVDPELVVAVRSLGRSRDGRLRQPTIVAMRPDLTAAELTDRSG